MFTLSYFNFNFTYFKLFNVALYPDILTARVLVGRIAFGEKKENM